MVSIKNLTDLARQTASCRRCGLFKTASRSVPGEGDIKRRIMFIGEAPGRTEDETGRPFVGRAGKLLEQLLNSIGIQRDHVFITSIVKHRPPKNRPPKPDEILACSFWLDHQIKIINPKLIVTLGKFSLEYFLPTNKISLIHGKIQEVTLNNKIIRLFPLYHPAAGLRSTTLKNILSADFQNLKDLLRYEL